MRKVLILFVTVLFISGCAKHDDRALAALKALQRVESATKIGVNIGEYHRLVADANAAVQEFLRDEENKTDAEAKKHLQTATAYYVSAGYFWNQGIKEGISGMDGYAEKVLSPLWKDAEKELREAEKLLK